MRKILSTMRRAVEDYKMIEAGDKVAVGVSGGKDSLTLLSALAGFRRFFPKPFELCAMTIDMGYEEADYSKVKELCAKLDVEYIIKDTNIAEIIFDIRKEKNPCSLCAKMRRGALNDLAKEHGCTKIALGHHNEDALETFYLSLFYEGRLSCFSPVTYLSRVDITVIRPFIYTSEKDIKSYAKRVELPIVHNPCPANGYTKRQDMKEFINEKEKEDKFFKTKTMNAIKMGLDNWKLEK